MHRPSATDLASPATHAGTAPSCPAWRCTWMAGPDAGGTAAITVGRHLVGRAPLAEVRCDDPDLQPHHGLLEVHPDGTLWMTQLTGRHPLLVDGRPVHGTTALPDRAWIEIGASALLCTNDVPGDPAEPAHVRDRCLVRRPRAVPVWTPTELAAPGDVPTRDQGPGGLLPALLGLAGAGAAAALLRQPLFLVFGTLGALVALASWAGQHLALRRRWRRDIAAHAAALAARTAALAADQRQFVRYHAAAVPTVASARYIISERSSELWARRRDHGDAFTVSFGTGDLAWRDDDAAPGGVAIVRRVAVPAGLGPGARVAVRGHLAPAMARAVLAQLVAGCGPADLRIVVVTDRPDRWAWARGLPQATMHDGSAAVVDDRQLGPTLADLDGEHRPHIVVVTDVPGVLATRTNPVRRALADQRLALLAVLPADGEVPHVCTGVLTIASDGRSARWVADARTTMLPVPVSPAGLGERAAAAIAGELGLLVDPEDPLCGDGALPATIPLTALLKSEGIESVTTAAIAARWAAAGPDPSPRTVIGMAADGVVDIDLVRDGPHALIAGTTGSGKSELLRSLVVGMVIGSSPAHLHIVLIDYKGGATFDACAQLPHVVGIVTDLDDGLADRVLRSLHAELRHREGVLRAQGAADLAALRNPAAPVVLPRLLVVVDEFAALVAEQPTFLHALVGIAQRGRSLGVHLVLATQRPAGVLSDDIRANTNLRLALRLHDSTDAVDVVGIREPAMLPRRLPGRAVMRLGADEHVVFQAARSGDDLAALVRAVDGAARLAGTADPRRPWQPALTSDLAADAVPRGAIGLVDDPDHQRIAPLRWCPADGHVLVVGSRGFGVTSTLVTLARRSVSSAHLYVIDGNVDDQWDSLAAHPACGAVVRVHERERLMRLLFRLRGEVRSRGAAGGGMSGANGTDTPIVLAIDGLDAVRRALGEIDTDAELDAFDEVLAAAPSGLTIVGGAERAASLPASFVARCPHRWVAHLHDVHDAAALGVASNQVPGPIPGRIVVASTGLHAQVARPGAPDPREQSLLATTPAAIECVASVVDADVLPPGRRDDGIVALPVGTDFVTGTPHLVEVPAGEHVLVIGPARTGRTTTLLRLANAWRRLQPGGWTGVLAPRRSALHCDPCVVHTDSVSLVAALPALGPALVIVDDAELVADTDGQLAAMLTGRLDTLVIAAGRPDALRQCYGHWTGVVRRSRLGFVSACGSDLDGDLLGAVLPRRLPIRPRPGLTWSVANGEARLVQVAVALHPPRRWPANVPG